MVGGIVGSAGSGTGRVVRLGLLALHPGQLGVAADGGERGAQLVRGVSQELAHLLLLRQPGGELGLDGRQQGVHGLGQLPHFGVGVADVDAPFQAGPLRRQLAGHLAGGVGHAVQPAQAVAHPVASWHPARR